MKTAMPAAVKTEPGALDELLAAVARGDREALASLYRQTHAAVYGFSLSMLKNAQDAEDVTHDCYVRIWSAAGDYRSQGKPMAWIITVAKNLCLKKLAERQKSAELPPEDYLLPAQEAVTAEDRLVLRACLAGLDPRESQIVVLHAVSGLKHREIARILGLPLSTVLSKYSRALKKLREQLEGGQKK